MFLMLFILSDCLSVQFRSDNWDFTVFIVLEGKDLNHGNRQNFYFQQRLKCLLVTAPKKMNCIQQIALK
jgi:hypothetical protein